jgi:hypothetical protein
MFTEHKLNRLQWVLLGIFVVLLLAYGFGYRALSRQAQELDEPLAALWDKLAKASREHPAIHGLAPPEMLSRLDELDQAEARMEAVERMARSRIALAPQVRARLGEPFQLLEFERHRFTLINELYQVAGKNNVAVERPVPAGYPEFSATQPEPVLLWPQLSIVHQILTSVVLQQPKAILNVTPLPRRAHYLENRNVLDEFPVRVQLRASADSALQILRVLPLLPEEMTDMGLPAVPGYKSAFFIDRFIIRNSTNALHEVELDVIVSGFVDRTGAKPE